MHGFFVGQVAGNEGGEFRGRLWFILDHLEIKVFNDKPEEDHDDSEIFECKVNQIDNVRMSNEDRHLLILDTKQGDHVEMEFDSLDEMKSWKRAILISRRLSRSIRGHTRGSFRTRTVTNASSVTMATCSDLASPQNSLMLTDFSKIKSISSLSLNKTHKSTLKSTPRFEIMDDSVSLADSTVSRQRSFNPSFKGSTFSVNSTLKRNIRRPVIPINSNSSFVKTFVANKLDSEMEENTSPLHEKVIDDPIEFPLSSTLDDLENVDERLVSDTQNIHIRETSENVESTTGKRVSSVKDMEDAEAIHVDDEAQQPQRRSSLLRMTTNFAVLALRRIGIGKKKKKKSKKSKKNDMTQMVGRNALSVRSPRPSSSEQSLPNDSVRSEELPIRYRHSSRSVHDEVALRPPQDEDVDENFEKTSVASSSSRKKAKTLSRRIMDKVASLKRGNKCSFDMDDQLDENNAKVNYEVEARKSQDGRKSLELRLKKKSGIGTLPSSSTDGELALKLKKWKESADTDKPVFSTPEEKEGIGGWFKRKSSMGSPGHIDPSRPPLPVKPLRFRQKQLRKLVHGELYPPESKIYTIKDITGMLDKVTMQIRAENRNKKKIDLEELCRQYDKPRAIQCNAEIIYYNEYTN